MIIETAIVCVTVVVVSSLTFVDLIDRRHVRPLEVERKLLEEHLKNTLTSSHHEEERKRVLTRLREITEKLESPSS